MRSDIWLVAGGEPGAERFGQLVQSLRKKKRLSVEALADEADLAVGTIRAIEQGRRAPSKESGVRLLQVLLPKGELSAEGVDPESGFSNDCSFTDPRSGSRVLVVFQAKTAGDNRRWSSDRPRAGESKAEGLMRELLNDSTRFEEVIARGKDAMAALMAHNLSAIADLGAGVERSSSDAAFGALMRRLAAANELRIERIEHLLDLWDRVDGDIGESRERDLAGQVNKILDEYVAVPHNELPRPK